MGTNYGSRSAAWWDPNLRNPYVMLAPVSSTTYENLRAHVSYQGSGGVGLIQNWQTNTFPIDFGTGNPAFQAQVLQAPQNFGPIPTWAMS